MSVLNNGSMPQPDVALPDAPAYGTGTLGEILPSAAAALGVPGFANALNLAPTRRVCVIMVDGLGWNQLRANRSHAPFLRGQFDAAQKLSTGFPSTTATSLSSLGTGLTPGEHGMLGYDVIDPNGGRVVNQLGGWPGNLDPLRWQPAPTVFEAVLAHGISTASISLPLFAQSALTRAALRGPEFIAANQPAARARAASEYFALNRNALAYVYFNELDKAGHKYGVNSDAWRETLEDLDLAIKSLVARLPEQTTVLITGDHGMVDVPASQRIDFSLFPELIDGVEFTSGEPRGVQLRFAADTSIERRQAVQHAWAQAYGRKAWVLSTEEAIEHGLYGPVSTSHRERLGDLVVLAAEAIAFYDGRRVPARAFEMIGQHGSLTAAERFIPLINLRTR
ncbi:alkaline phosphatase family protein [Glutamicibacter endophyticus]|uniref:alkaline phosphatase family protein n=1 Tax=Glutamicibacter endophyticus TaxID=1522174 RepID=UPI003AF03CB0